MKITLLLLCISLSISAQVKGIVKDSLTGKPIAYVNIWVENENTATSSEEDGNFKINSEANKNLIFTAVGYEKKIVSLKNATVVQLLPKEYTLEEVVILNKKETKIVEIGKTKSAIYQAFDNGPRVDVKFFPYLPKYKKTRFIKQLSLETDSKIENATLKMHFYTVDAKGYPGEELLNKDLIITVKKGLNKTFVTIADLNLKMPKNGLFVGFEKLLIPKNTTEETIKDANKNTTYLKKTYNPLVLYNFVEKEFSFTYLGGKWIKQEKIDSNNMPLKTMINEPSLNLILTN